MEGEVKGLVISLLARESIAADKYVLLLDWLDKVRVGLWLGYSYLHKNPLNISPSFHIDSRIGKKDRMVAIYTVETQNQGLNTYGAETLCFQYQPSCFSLNINNTYLLNMSWDFLCSARCGFPFPKEAIIDLEYSNVSITHKVKHPIFRKKLIKPSIHVYEPIIQATDFSADDWLQRRLIPSSTHKGVIYRQWDNRVEVINNLRTSIENGEVKGIHCKPLAEIIAQTYQLQLESCAGHKYRSMNRETMAAAKARNNCFQKQNKAYRNAFLEVLRQPGFGLAVGCFQTGASCLDDAGKFRNAADLSRLRRGAGSLSGDGCAIAKGQNHGVERENTLRCETDYAARRESYANHPGGSSV
ncbi:MAG: hypothetical protein ACTHLX_20050, partial [Candidatus Binatia bacterium]